MTDLTKQLSRTKRSAEQCPAIEPIRTVLGSAGARGRGRVMRSRTYSVTTRLASGALA